MRLDIGYVTRFRYANAVTESQNELRACPVTDHRQQLISYRLETTPAARILSSTDYWGTRVDAFGVRFPHDELEIVAEAAVETRPTPAPKDSPPLDALRDPLFVDRHVEYLSRTAHTDWGPTVEDEARRRADGQGDVAGVARALHESVGTTLCYAPGTTYVGVPVDQVLERREGVCQDYAHLVIALCRSRSIPARYVSGYLFTVDDATGADTAADVVDVQTHAWVEVAVPGFGWWSLDPTNRQEVTERHVKIGHGRDYDDVPPLKGVFSGPPEHQLDVTVQMRRSSQEQQQQ